MKRPNIGPAILFLCASIVCVAAGVIVGIYDSRQRQLERNRIREMVDGNQRLIEQVNAEIQRVRALAESPTFKPGVSTGEQIWTGSDFRGVITNYPAQ